MQSSVEMKALRAHLAGPVDFPGLAPLVAEATWEECDGYHGVNMDPSTCMSCQGTGRVDTHLALRMALRLGWACLRVTAHEHCNCKEGGHFKHPGANCCYALTQESINMGLCDTPFDHQRFALRAADAWLAEPTEERLGAWRLAGEALGMISTMWIPTVADAARPSLTFRVTLPHAARVIRAERAWALLGEEVRGG